MVIEEYSRARLPVHIVPQTNTHGTNVGRAPQTSTHGTNVGRAQVRCPKEGGLDATNGASPSCSPSMVSKVASASLVRCGSGSERAIEMRFCGERAIELAL